MKTRTSFLFLLMALSSIGVAQQGPPPRELMLMKRIFVALVPKVKSEIKLTSDEYTKVLDAFGGALEVDGDSIRLTLSGPQDLGAMEVDAMKVLDSAQRKRLDEIWIQRLKGAALADDEIAKKVGLSAAQKKEADRLVDEGGAAISDLASEGPSPDMKKRFDDIRTKYGKKIEALLTDSQKRAYEDLKGKPFAPKASG
jgi:hypothetical protein